MSRDTVDNTEDEVLYVHNTFKTDTMHMYLRDDTTAPAACRASRVLRFLCRQVCGLFVCGTPKDHADSTFFYSQFAHVKGWASWCKECEGASLGRFQTFSVVFVAQADLPTCLEKMRATLFAYHIFDQASHVDRVTCPASCQVSLQSSYATLPGAWGTRRKTP